MLITEQNTYANKIAYLNSIEIKLDCALAHYNFLLNTDNNIALDKTELKNYYKEIYYQLKSCLARIKQEIL